MSMFRARRRQGLGAPDYPDGVNTVTAQQVATEVRRRLPGVGAVKLHKLLYYCQGHHLATYGTPLFAETISAWDMGPVVGELWYQERQDGSERPTGSSSLSERELNTVGYVLSRYGALTGNDLAHLTHSEAPWVQADRNRGAGARTRIEQDSIAAYFRGPGADEADEDTPLPDEQAVRAWLATAPAPSGPVGDTVGAIRARLS